MNNFLRDWHESAQWYDVKEINILAGPNGSGKSTMLDLIGIIGNLNLLATIARENRAFDSVAALMIDFDNRKRLWADIRETNQLSYDSDDHVKSKGIDSQGVAMQVQLQNAEGDWNAIFEKTEINISKLAIGSKAKTAFRRHVDECDCSVHYWRYDPTLSPHDVVSVLNGAGKLLAGIISEPGVIDNTGFGPESFEYRQKEPFIVLEGETDRIGVFLADDQSQTSTIKIEALPSGWKQLVSLVAWLEKRPKGSIALIDEPETHLHPTLQRYLVQRITEIANSKCLQLFIATHSPYIQQVNAWRGRENQVCILEATSKGINVQPNVWQLLNALGVKNSDVSQSNGVIWVEGPTDRIYLKHWLHLWCESERVAGREVLEPLENVDYSFIFYGGSVLSHFSSVEDGTAFINLLKINRNAALIMDNDNDFILNNNGLLAPKIWDTTKGRVIKEFNSLKAEKVNCEYWVTRGYTIESYFPVSFLNEHFETSQGKLAPKWRKKTDISDLYIKMHRNWSTASEDPNHLVPMISGLYNLINVWRV